MGLAQSMAQGEYPVHNHREKVKYNISLNKVLQNQFKCQEQKFSFL